MSSLTIQPPANAWRNDEVAPTTLHVVLTGAGIVTHYRMAQVADDLGYATWIPAPSSAFDLPVYLPGYQSPGPCTIALEARYSDGATEVIISAPITRGTPTVPPGPTVTYLMRAIFPTGLPYAFQQYNDTTPRPGNNFIPFDWSPELGGYAWSTERTRAIDVGETPDDIIAAHVYARWMPGAPNFWDFGPNTTALKAVLSSKNLDLKGGKLYFAVLCQHPDGKRGRYHLYAPARALNVGIDADFQETLFVFPSSSNPDWKCSFAADNVGISNMPTGPSFAIEAVEIVIRDFTAEPTGQLRIKEFAVIQ